MDRLVIGTVGKAQGIKGEVKINPLTDDVERFKRLKQVYVGDIIYTIEHVKVLVNGVFIKFNEILDRNTAEGIKNLKIEIDRKDALKLDDDRYFIVDIIGSQVISGGIALGTLVNVLQYGSADIYQIKGDKKFMFPALKDVIIDIDIKNKRITVDAKRLEEVAVYED